MADPILRIRSSGYGGSGYLIPTRNLEGKPRRDAKEKPWRVPGVTTVLGALEKGGVVQWAVDQTAAYAVANAHALQERDEDWGFRNLRFYHSRKPNYDDPEVNLHNYHSGVLDDLANTGTIIHEAIEAFVKDDPFGAPEFTRQGQVDAFQAFLDWVFLNQPEFELCEVTVVHPEHGWAGTLDLVLKLNGKRYLVDVKSSRYRIDPKTGLKVIHDSHISQVATLAQAPIMMLPGTERTDLDYKDLSWTEVDMPKYDGYAILQVRPTSTDEYGQDIPAFCEFIELDSSLIEPGYQMFLGALEARRGQNAIKKAMKEVSK